MGEKITKMDRQPIISAKDVEITFSLRGKKLNAIRKCSLDLYDGETLAIVGESGSGKSVFTKTFVGMLDVNGKITGGSIMYEGRDMTKFTEKDWLGIRGKKIAMVMQDPMTSLNPLKKIGKQIQESIEHHQGLKGEEAKKAAITFNTMSSTKGNKFFVIYFHIKPFQLKDISDLKNILHIMAYEPYIVYDHDKSTSDEQPTNPL